MKKFLKRAASFTVVLAMLLLNAPKMPIAKAEGALPSIPKTIFALPSDLDTTWSKNGDGTLDSPGGTNQYIYWGRYPQSEITDTNGLTENVDYVSSNNKYFKIEPIKWRILSNSDGKLFLISDKGLDAKSYGSGYSQTGINWSNCELRTWLTGTFLNAAFKPAEQGKIAVTTVSAPYATSIDGGSFDWSNPGPSVTDKLFLLSGDYTDANLADVGLNSELRNTAYGFASDRNSYDARKFALTDFAKANGAYDYGSGYGLSWSRSSSFFSKNSSAIAFQASHVGYLHFDYASSRLSVAPALKIPLSSVLFSSAAQGAASPSANGGNFSAISENPSMMLRFSGEQGTVTKTGNIVNYASAPEGSSLVVVATDTNGSSYQYSESLESASGSVDLSSKGLTEGSTYQAWVEQETDGILYASNSATGNIDSNKHTITYKNYDGSDVENLPENYPTTYTEGETLTLPTDSPDSAMSGWEFLGFWDCPLDQSKKVTVTGPSYEDEQALDLTVGNKITEISAQATGDVTLYARYTSDVFDKDVNGRENYIFAAPGVFPNGSTASMRILEAGTQEYKDTLQHVDDKDIPNIKIVEFQVHNAQGESIQPKTLFGDAVIGFKIPDGFNVDDISLIRVVANGEDITLRSKVWTDPDNSDLKYIEGVTNHFSPYAILSPWNESIVATGDNTWAWVTGISAVLLVSAGIFVLMNRKNKSEKV